MKQIIGYVGLLLGVLFCLSGCATTKTYSKLEIDPDHSMTFPNTTRLTASGAIEALFKMAHQDHQFEVTNQGMKVSRNFTYLSNTILETWEIEIEDTPKGLRIRASALAESDSLQYPATAPHYYELFFRRLRYFLRQSDEWETCTEYETRTANLFKHYKFLCTASQDSIPKPLWPQYGISDSQ